MKVHSVPVQTFSTKDLPVVRDTLDPATEQNSFMSVKEVRMNI